MSTADDWPVSIGIVDDHPILRRGLAAVLATEPRFSVVAEGSSAEDAVSIAEVNRPQIMLIDLEMPGGGLSAIRQIGARYPSVRCIVLSVCNRAEIAIEAINAGAQGYILKGVGAAELCGAILTVKNDQSFVSPEFATKLLSAAQKKSDEICGSDIKLSCREGQILQELERGFSNKEIARKLDVSEKTIKYYMTNIMSKLGVSNRVSAVIAYQKARVDAPAKIAPN